jgi:hypothetical protein
MPFKEEVAIVFTIDRIDVLLRNGPIPLPLHLSQPDIYIDPLLRSTKEANQQRKDSFRGKKEEEKKNVLGNKFFSALLFTLLSKNGLKILCSASTTFLLFSSSSASVSSLCKNCPNPHNLQISQGT